MLSMLILAAGCSTSISDRDANAAIMYMQSFIAPALIGVCKEMHPSEAPHYDDALKRWAAHNKRVVRRGERVSRKYAGCEGTDIDLAIGTEVEALVADVRSSPAAEQEESCANILDLLRSES